MIKILLIILILLLKEEKRIIMLEREIKTKHIYKHFKGNYYFVEDVAYGSEDNIQYVVYRALYGDYKLYIRPLEMFLSKVDKNKYPDIKQMYRFELVEKNKKI